MKQAVEKPNKAEPVTGRDHHFYVCSTPLAIPAGITVDQCLADSGMYGCTARDMLEHAVSNSIHASIDERVVWSAIHLLELSEALRAAAHIEWAKAHDVA